MSSTSWSSASSRPRIGWWDPAGLKTLRSQHSACASALVAAVGAPVPLTHDLPEASVHHL